MKKKGHTLYILYNIYYIIFVSVLNFTALVTSFPLPRSSSKSLIKKCLTYMRLAVSHPITLLLCPHYYYHYPLHFCPIKHNTAHLLCLWVHSYSYLPVSKHHVTHWTYFSIRMHGIGLYERIQWVNWDLNLSVLMHWMQSYHF